MAANPRFGLAELSAVGVVVEALVVAADEGLATAGFGAGFAGCEGPVPEGLAVPRYAVGAAIVEDAGLTAGEGPL